MYFISSEYLKKYFKIGIDDPEYRDGFLRFIADVANRNYLKSIHFDLEQVSNKIDQNRENFSKNNKIKRFSVYYSRVLKIGDAPNCFIKSLNDFMVALIFDTFAGYGQLKVFKMPGLEVRIEKLIFYFENQINILSFLRGFVKFLKTFFEFKFYSEDKVSSIIDEIEKKKFAITNNERVQSLSSCYNGLDLKTNISETTIKSINDLMLNLISNTSQDCLNVSELKIQIEKLKNYYSTTQIDDKIKNTLYKYLNTFLNLNSFDSKDKEFYLNELDQRKENLFLNEQIVNYLNYFQTAILEFESNDVLCDQLIRLMLHLMMKTEKDLNDNLENRLQDCFKKFNYLKRDSCFVRILETAFECDKRSKYDFVDFMEKLNKTSSESRGGNEIRKLDKKCKDGDELLLFSSFVSIINALEFV